MAMSNPRRNKIKLDSSRLAIRRAVMENLELRTLLSGGGLAFGNPTTHPGGGGGNSVLITDLNGDGRNDVITANYNGSVTVMFGNANGSFQPGKTSVDGLVGGISVITTATLSSSQGSNSSSNAPKGASIIIGSTNGGVSVLTANADGSFQAPVISQLNHGIYSIIASDVNGDGKPDLIVGYSNGTFGVALGNSGGTFAPATVNNTHTGGANTVGSVSMADFNGDGKPDLLVTNRDGSVNLFLTNTAGVINFNSPSQLVAPAMNTSAFVGTLTGHFGGTQNKRADVALVNYSGAVSILLSNGDGSFAVGQTTSANAAGIVGGAVGDVTGDGIADLVLADNLTGQVIVLPGNADGTFGPPRDFTVGANPTSVALSDFNGDGRVDIVTTSYGTQSQTVLLNQSTLPPTITSVNNATFFTRTAGSFTITTAGFPAGFIRETGHLPRGLSLHNIGNGKAVITGTPAFGTGGSYSVTISARNRVGSTTANGQDQTFTLIVNQPRLFTSASSATFATGHVGTFTIRLSGYPITSVTELGAIPAGLTLSAFTPSASKNIYTATITGSPAPGTGGAHPLTFSINGRPGSPNVNQFFTLTIHEPAAITSNNVTFVVGTAQTFHILTTGFPLATITETGLLPAGVRLINSHGVATLVGTAATAGTYHIMLQAGNGILPKPAPQAFTLLVH